MFYHSITEFVFNYLQSNLLFLLFAVVNNKRTSKRSYGFLDKVTEIVEGVFQLLSHTMRISLGLRLVSTSSTENHYKCLYSLCLTDQSHSSKLSKTDEEATSREDGDKEYEEWKQKIIESATKSLSAGKKTVEKQKS